MFIFGATLKNFIVFTLENRRYTLKSIATEGNIEKMKNSWSQDKYIKALRFAAEKHKGQKFPGTDWSYTVHLNMVAMEIIAALSHEPDAKGELAVQVALLHDVIEDTETIEEELQSKFSQEITDGVVGPYKKQKALKNRSDGRQP